MSFSHFVDPLYDQSMISFGHYVDPLLTKTWHPLVIVLVLSQPVGMHPENHPPPLH